MNTLCTLVIFELFEETAHLFLIPDKEITKEMREKFEACAGKYINDSDISDEEMDLVDELYREFYIYEGNDEYSDNPNPGTFVRWKIDSFNYECDGTEIRKIYQMGFLP